MLTKQEAEKRGWIVASWEEPRLVPVSWTASGKRVSKTAPSEGDLLRFIAHSISGSGSVITSKTGGSSKWTRRTLAKVSAPIRFRTDRPLPHHRCGVAAPRSVGSTPDG